VRRLGAGQCKPFLGTSPFLFEIADPFSYERVRFSLSTPPPFYASEAGEVFVRAFEERFFPPNLLPFFIDCFWKPVNQIASLASFKPFIRGDVLFFTHTSALSLELLFLLALSRPPAAISTALRCFFDARLLLHMSKDGRLSEH